MTETKDFNWLRHPKLEEFFIHLADEAKKHNVAIAEFEQKLVDKTSTRLLDWVDHFIIAGSDSLKDKLKAFGFEREKNIEQEAYFHPGVLLPGILIEEKASKVVAGIALKVENISDFLQFNGVSADIEGSPYSPYRRACVARKNEVDFYVVERKGTRTYQPESISQDYWKNYFEAVEAWKKVPRFLEDEEEAFDQIFAVTNKIVKNVGADMAADIIMRGEREYWMSRNYMGRVQKSRQDVLGMGWMNWDHHTFRSSRKHFSKLVNFFKLIGFEQREKFFAGEEAGWGAQVMENSNAGFVLFLDVDLSSEELEIDFLKEELPERDELGTVGLWCALHGDSILTAGLHHIAGNFLFDKLTEDMTNFNLKFMKPFSQFSYLRQAFSKGEIWQIDESRVKKLLTNKKISQKQADKFLSKGAVGSHLENLQRRDGYKGFNQQNVSAIIKETDPRSYSTTLSG